MPTLFIPPDVHQVSWMITRGVHREHLSLATKIHEMLCTYSLQHGLPNGNTQTNEWRLEYEIRLASEIQAFEIPSTGRALENEFKSLVADTNSNKNLARDLHGRARTNKLLVSETDEFLNSLLDAYAFVATAARNVRRKQRP